MLDELIASVNRFHRYLDRQLDREADYEKAGQAANAFEQVGEIR